MTSPLRIRTPKETILANIELLPEADLWKPIIEKADDSGYVSKDAAGEILATLGYSERQFHDWATSRGFLCFSSHEICDVAELHEYWVSQQPDT